MEWRKWYLDAVLVPCSLLMMFCYHIYLWYKVDPSGSYFSWERMFQVQIRFLRRGTQEIWNLMMPFTDIKGRGEISSKNIEIGKIGANKVFRVLTPAEIDDYLAQVE